MFLKKQGLLLISNLYYSNNMFNIVSLKVIYVIVFTILVRVSLLPPRPVIEDHFKDEIKKIEDIIMMELGLL